MTTRGDLSNNAVPTAGTNLTSTDGGDDNRGEPKMKKPWDAYPSFSGGCSKCRHTNGCFYEKCLGDGIEYTSLEFKVRQSIKRMLTESPGGEHFGKNPDRLHLKDMLKNTKRIGPNKDKQKWVSYAPSAEVEKLLPAALKANGYTV